jgi:DNA-binding winged helix-turn-helix (wHTH) protein
MRLRFGDCLFDSKARALVRAGKVVRLSPKAFALLQELLKDRPEALSKRDIHDRVWPDTFVSEASLARLVSEIRAAIGDDSRAPRFIRTVHGYGYAFSGEASSTTGGEEPGAACSLLWGERAIVLAPGENILGRTPQAVVSIPSPKVSRRHARIVVSGSMAILEDLASKNGTYLGGRKILTPVELADGDRISIGPAVLLFRKADDGGSTETEAGP